MPFDPWRFDALLFDFDGTLADSRADVWESLCFAAAQVGGAFPEEVLREPANLSRSMEWLLGRLEPPVSRERLARFDQETARHYRVANSMGKTALYPGIESLLIEARKRGIPCCIATLKPVEALGRVLRQKGWERYFDRWLAPDSLGGKPLSKGELIGVLLHLLKAESPVYIGDSGGDVTAAHQNGIPCIAVTYGDGDSGELLAAGPAYLAADVGGILAALRAGR